MSRKGVSCLVAAVLALAACSRQPASEPDPNPAPSPTIVPYDYGKLVYYFDVTGDQYRRSLATFLKKHADLRCRYFGADEVTEGILDQKDTHIVGHTIVCTDTAQNAQDETVP